MNQKSLLLCLALLLPVLSWAQNEPPPLVSGQKVQVKKLTRDMFNVRSDIPTVGPSEFQDASIVQARQKRFKQFTEALKRYPQVNDPLVQAARQEYTALQQALSTEFKRAKEQLQTLGDVQARLKQLQQNFGQYPVPKPLQPPFTANEVADWLKQASAARTVGEHNLKELNAIAPLAYLPNNPGVPQSGAPYDLDDVKRMQQHAIQMQSTVQNNYQQMSSSLNNSLQHINQQLSTRWQEDPEGDKKWLFLQADQVQQAQQLFDEARAIINSSLALEQALQQDHSLATQVAQKLEQAEQAFQDNAQRALQASRLPEPVSDNDDMINIATQIIKKPSYEFGQYGPIVLTTEAIVERENKSSEIEIDDVDVTLSGDLKMSGTETTWTYRWQEFKFATPIKHDDGRWYIWWITAKKYSSGSSVTPLGQWVAGKSMQGNPILESNF